MSAMRAMPATWLAGRCCASRARSTRSPRQWRRSSRAGSADRAAQQEARQQNERGEERPAALPRLERERGAGVAVDLPGEIIGPAGKGGSRLGEAQQREELAA